MLILQLERFIDLSGRSRQDLQSHSSLSIVNGPLEESLLLALDEKIDIVDSQRHKFLEWSLQRHQQSTKRDVNLTKLLKNQLRVRSLFT